MEKVQPEIVLIKTSSSSIRHGLTKQTPRRRRDKGATAVAASRRGVQSSARFSRRICHDLFILINGHAIYLANSCDVLLPAICTLLALRIAPRRVCEIYANLMAASKSIGIFMCLSPVVGLLRPKISPFAYL